MVSELEPASAGNEGAPFHLLEATIDSIHRAMIARELTCQQLVQLYLDRIAAYDKTGPAINALQMVSPAALAEAARLDAQLGASGRLVGPLHGIPVLVKDQVETSDMPTTYGSALFQDFVPQRNATIVDKLKAAGAVVIGKTTMGEFAQGWAGTAFGYCRNPYSLERNPSGSSSGSGAGLAANFGTVAIGEDTGGSIRGPAAFNNLVGLRPTLPLVSRFGVMPVNPTRDTLGPLARTVRDAAILLDVIAGYDPEDPLTAACVGHAPSTYSSFLTSEGLRGMRLGVIREQMARDTDPTAADYKQVRTVIDQALSALADCGVEIVDELTIPGVLEAVIRFSGDGSFETEEATDRYLAEHPNAPVKTLREIVLSSEVLPARRTRLMESIGRSTQLQGYLQELLAREDLRRATLKVMADYGLHALAYPTFHHVAAPTPADVMTRTANPVQPGNNRILSPLIGFPALSVPAGFTPDGLPVGIELLGRPFTEGTLFHIGYAYEQATHHRTPPGTTPALATEP